AVSIRAATSPSRARSTGIARIEHFATRHVAPISAFVFALASIKIALRQRGWTGNGIFARSPIRPNRAWNALGVIGAPVASVAGRGFPRAGADGHDISLVTRGDAKIDYRRHARACERYNRFSRHLPSPGICRYDNLGFVGAHCGTD